MDGGADRDILERQRIANLDRGIGSRYELSARPDALRGHDVAPLSIGIAQQREKCAAIGIIFETLDLRGDAVLFRLKSTLRYSCLWPPP
jgi:hypothetical protein